MGGLLMKTYRKLVLAFAVLVLSAAFFHTPCIDAETSDLPAFDAYIIFSSQGYLVKGIFKEFTPDIARIQPQYSLDGKIYHTCGVEWDLNSLGSEDPEKITYMQDQTCLYQSHEPLKNYLSGEIDRFYLKLCLTHEDGTTLVTRPSVIDRGALQPLPEGINLIATFTSSMSVRQMRPYVRYGRYQITVSADATPEEILSYLPDTLPIEIQLQKGIDHFTEGVTECPVTWKPLPSFSLIPGESVTISDAAEEIVVPVGTVLNTPMGIFQLEEPVKIDEPGLSDEVELVLNAARDGNPTGVLTMENDGLEFAFDQKPTGATSIRAYTITEHETKWTELDKVPLLTAIDSQPSVPNSGYTLVLENDQEPLRSYLAAKETGGTPVPFIVGLKIEGGVYDGRQLLLTWPETYDLPLQLPELGGAGGNENNAGAGNTGDGTAEGQRPVLPQASEQPPVLPQVSEQLEENLPEHTPAVSSIQSSGGKGQPDQKVENRSDGLFDVTPLSVFTRTLGSSRASAKTHVRTPFPAPSGTGTSPQTGSSDVQIRNPLPAADAETSPSDQDTTAGTSGTQTGTFVTQSAETPCPPAQMKQASSVLPAETSTTGGISIAVIVIAAICIAGTGIFILMRKKKSGDLPDKTNH